MSRITINTSTRIEKLLADEGIQFEVDDETMALVFTGDEWWARKDTIRPILDHYTDAWELEVRADAIGCEAWCHYAFAPDCIPQEMGWR